MKNTLLLFALAILPTRAAILAADLIGIPDDYRFYRDLTGTLALTTRHSGQFAIDTDTGAGTLTIRLEVLGGPEAAAFGGIGAQHTGSTPIHMDPAGAAMLWAGLLALPDQQYYWGGDHTNDFQFHVGPIDFGSGICIGCGDMPMGALYMFQRVPLLNYWTGVSTLNGQSVYSGDAIFRAVPATTHLPEPGAWALMAIGIVVLMGRKRSSAGTH